VTGPRSKYTTAYTPSVWPYWDNTLGHKFPNGVPDHTPLPGVVYKDEIITTQGNPYHKLGKSSAKIGGNFMVIKRTLRDGSLPPMDYSGSSDPMDPNSPHYYGPLRAAGFPTTSAQWPSPVFPSEAEANAWGATAIANTIPTNPVSGLFVALGELKRDGIPTLTGIEGWKNRTNVARGAGSEYLNHQFGWLPLVSDLKKFTHATRDHDSLIRQYERNSGKRIKRTFQIPMRTVSTSQAVGNAYPGPSFSFPYVNGADARYQQINRITTERWWFRGAFTYYLPPYNPNGDNIARNEQLANYLYGTRPTPEGVWDLAPWSWAADWVTNAGDVLHNIGAFQQDGLVLSYGYVMYHSIASVVVTHPKLQFKSRGGSGPSFTFNTEVKARWGATPYGFGASLGSFTDRQWAILVALGLSRGNKQMR
jgi:hypothetical protein